MSTNSRFAQQVQQITDFRLSVVAELANPYLAYGELKTMIKAKAALPHDMPWSSKNGITEGTIRKWLEAYRQYGKEGLRPKSRSDKGKSRAVSNKDEQTFVEYLRSHPELTAINAWKKLYREGHISKPICSSTLSRIIKTYGLQPEQRLIERANEQTLKFQFYNPLECVQADCLHGPCIPDENGKPVKAILLAFIDDATRRIVYADFGKSEHSLAFEKGIRHILSSQGRIIRLYVDNGSTFVSNQTSRILDTLQVHLIHSKVYQPKGRGKIERFFRTVRDSFLRVLDVETIKGFDDLNLRFRTWLEAEYHRSPHRGLPDRQTPLECWLEKSKSLVPLDPTLNLDQEFFHGCHRRVAKDQTITINSILFETPSILVGKKVTLRYNLHIPLRTVEAWFEGKNYGNCRLVNSYENTKVKRSNVVKGAVTGASAGTAGNVQAGLAASQWRLK